MFTSATPSKNIGANDTTKIPTTPVILVAKLFPRRTIIGIMIIQLVPFWDASGVRECVWERGNGFVLGRFDHSSFPRTQADKTSVPRLD
jgi:hypothetical protein